MRRLGLILGSVVMVLWAAPVRAQETTGTIRGRVTADTTPQPLSGVVVTFGGQTALTRAYLRHQGSPAVPPDHSGPERPADSTPASCVTARDRF